MKKITSKLFNVFLIVSIIFVSFFNTPKVYAKTVKDLESELKKLEIEAKENKDKIKYTVEQINQARKDIAQINIDMDNISKEIIAKNKEIEDLNEEIQDRDEETKQLMEFIQLTNGSSIYLEYIMGAEDLTDFLFRISVAEQLSEYNSDLITKMNEMIKANEKRKIELNNKTIELDKEQDKLSVSLKILANEKIKFDEYDRSLEDEIAVAHDVIKMYRDAGCGDNEDVNVCANRILPSDTRFWRPLARGVVTSEFGKRTYYNKDRWVTDYHYGIDVSNSGTTKVYAVANGKVAKVLYDKSCGNMVVIHHKIISSGKIRYYSSTYCHFASVSIKDGSAITKDTVIGIMGSTGNSTGPHVHLAISNGLRYKDYVSYNDYIANSFNPRNVINFPTSGYFWNDRITRY